MHSTFWYLVELDDDAPTSGEALYEHAMQQWLNHYEDQLDSNNWFTGLYCAERDGQAAKNPEVEGEPSEFAASWKSATIAVLYDLSMYSTSIAGGGPVFMDINPMAYGKSGQDQEIAEVLDQASLERLILERGASYLAQCYRELDASSTGQLEHYRRRRFTSAYELFASSDSRPFSDDRPTPYEYPAVDLRQGRGGREAILAVDIHT